MIVRPAIREDAHLLQSWWTRELARTAIAWPSRETVSWFERVLGRDGAEFFVAEQGGERVGSLIMEDAGELRWVIAPQHRGKGLGKKMVALVAEPHHLALIAQDDLASRTIASYSGFDLVEDGCVQLWRANRADPYC